MSTRHALSDQVNCYAQGTTNAVDKAAQIKLLPISTRSQLRSSQILTSLPQLVSELVQNALDAGATQIDVGVEPHEWTCWVWDNGNGMTMDGMALLAKGSEEGRYGSS